jgi:drug/metabolite transporter (DMT)-like permease
LALFGVAQMGVGYILLTIGSQLVPPTANALVGALDAPLAPLWVWIALGEAPTLATLGGGTIVLAAVVGHVLLENRAPPRSAGDGGATGA